MKIFKENAGSIDMNLLINLEKMVSPVKTEISEVSEKFLNQLDQLFLQNSSIEDNEAIQDRVKKACVYFLDKTETVLFKNIPDAHIESDNKAVRKSIQEVIERLSEDIHVKLSCLKACQTGFVAKNYLEVRAKAAIDKKEVKKVQKISGDQNYSSTEHPKLYSKLKAWRNEKADEMNVPVYMVLQQKTLMALVNILPASIDQLKTIKGFGKKKIKVFGDEIIEIIIAYCSENNLETTEQIIETNLLPEKIKVNTKQKSFELFKSGKTIFEIATERGMSPTTIEGHLASFIDTGELQIEQFVSPEKLEIISDYFTKAEIYSLTPAKEALGNDVSYAEIRFVLKHLEYTGKINLK